MYKLKKLNDIVVNPIKVNHPNPDKILGYSVIPMLTANIFICGKKGSGKTNVMFKIMESCIDKNTCVVVFCQTHAKDLNWLNIKTWLENRKQPFYFYDSTISEDGISNVDILMEKMKESKPNEEANKNKKKKPLKKDINYFLFGDGTEKENKEKIKPKSKVAPDYFVVFDDMSNGLRAKKDVQILCKHMRHFNSKVIISSQFPNDIDPATRAQMDFWMLFRGFGENKLEDVYPQLDFRELEFDKFYKIYLDVTKEPHSFLYIDRDHNTLRKNFNLEILI